MVKCTFLGHPEVFERDLPDKLDAAIAMVLRKNEGAEFLFYQKGTFYDLCLTAVLKARRRYPKKQIIVTLVQDSRDIPIQQPIPMCLIDTLLHAPQFPLPKKEHDFTLNYRRTVKWVLEQCSYLISYIYPLADKDEGRYYQFSKRKKLTILDVTDPETTAYMEDCLRKRSEREQIIAKGRQEGQTWSEIGSKLGVTYSMVQTNSRSTSTALIRSAVDRLRKQTENEVISCGIFCLGSADPERLDMFARVVQFLVTRYRVNEFKISVESSYTAYRKYMNILNQIVKRYPGVKISIITHYVEDTPENMFLESVAWHERFCDSVENLKQPTKCSPRTQMFNVIRWLMNNTDYCICQLTDSPIQKNIKNFARNVGGVRLLDIGKNVCENGGNPG